ncbi:hypothetical protein SDC9_147289 [bioreactor metagenome]|uniref:Uncharacterized protein n=1 Tax=bioreactor metagenome TaxID=1076179 RepID=A0A645EDG6_9ZZZZ
MNRRRIGLPEVQRRFQVNFTKEFPVAWVRSRHLLMQGVLQSDAVVDDGIPAIDELRQRPVIVRRFCVRQSM